MCENQQKADTLRAGGYFFDYHHGTYVNKKLKVIFSIQFADSRSAEDLAACIGKVVPRTEWQFFCLRPPLPAARAELEAAYS